MMIFLFVGLQMLSVYTQAPFLCFMIGDRADTLVRSVIDSIGNYFHFQNCTQLHMSPSDCRYVSENMPVMIPVHPQSINLLTPGWARFFWQNKSWSFKWYINRTILMWVNGCKVKKIHSMLSFFNKIKFSYFSMKIWIFFGKFLVNLGWFLTK